MSTEIERKQIDKRTVARYLQRGHVDQRDYDKYLKALPDLEDQAQAVETEQPEGDGPQDDEKD